MNSSAKAIPKQKTERKPVVFATLRRTESHLDLEFVPPRYRKNAKILFSHLLDMFSGKQTIVLVYHHSGELRGKITHHKLALDVLYIEPGEIYVPEA